MQQLAARDSGPAAMEALPCLPRFYLAHVNGWGFPRVAGVLLESKAHNGNPLPGDCVEHGIDDALHKPLFLVVIDRHHLQSTSPL